MSPTETADANPAPGPAGRAGPGASHEPPAWTTVMKQQVRLVSWKQRRSLALLALAAAVVSLLRLAPPFPADAAVAATEILILAPAYGFGLLIALVWPVIVWSDEGPGDRSYHWSLPVPRAVHDLTRTGVGGAWFLTAALVGLAVGFLTVFVGWGRPTVPGAPGPLVAAALGLTVAYLGGSVVAQLTEHPFRWLLGIFIGLVLFGTLGAMAAMRWPWAAPVYEVGLSVFQGSYGLNAALDAPRTLARGDAAASDAWAALLLWLGLAVAAVVASSLVFRQRAKGAAQ